MTNDTKTHWLQSQNKNYLGFPDLPSGQDVVLTIKTAQLEEVENRAMIIDKKPVVELKKVVRFVETAPWIKPFICNQTNSQMLITVTGQTFMEDCTGKKIQIGASKTKVKGESVDCLRVRNITSAQLQNDNVITTAQHEELLDLLDSAGKNITEFCAALKITKLNDLQEARFPKIKERLIQIAKENENN